MAWHSGADFIKDLADIDEFNAFGNSFSLLYSFGRGSRTREKPPYSNDFIDPRTGEVINLDNGNLDVSNTYYKTRGRGSALGCISRSKFQLQKQLRLARPLGSSDEIFESFCKRNFPTTANKNSFSASDSESDPQKCAILTKSDDFGFHSNKVRKRIKATRNSKLQSNALISSLLSKGLNKSDKNIGEEQNEISCIKKDNSFQKSNNFQNDNNFIDYESDNDVKTTTGSVSMASHELNDKNAAISDNQVKKKYSSGKEMKLDCLNAQKDKGETKPDIFNSLLQRKPCLYEKQHDNNVYDFKIFSECINSSETDSENEQNNFPESVSKHFITNDYDFPPLRKT